MQKEKNMRCLLNWHRTEVNNSSRHQRRKRSESCTLTLGRLLSTVFWKKMEIWDKGTSRTAFASNSSTLFRSHCQWPLVWCPHIYRANDSLPAIQLDNSPEGTETSFSMVSTAPVWTMGFFFFRKQNISTWGRWVWLYSLDWKNE